MSTLVVWALLLLIKPLLMTVTPTVCIAPCQITIALQVIPHPDNKWIAVNVDGPFSAGSFVQLDGERSAVRARPLVLQGLPEGDYLIQAILYRTTGEAARERIHMEVH